MFIVYLYDQNKNILAQIDDLISVDDIHIKLNGISSTKVRLYHTSDYCKRELLREMRRITVKKVVDNKEKVVIDGVIRWLEADLNGVEIIINDLVYLLDRRIIFASKNYNNKSIQEIFEELLNTTNARYDTGISCKCSEDKINLEIKQGETILSVLRKVVKLGYNFKIENWVLKIAKIVWKDRTTGNEYMEYRYDILTPEERNINWIKIRQDSTNIINWVWITWSSIQYYKDDESIAKFWLNEKAFGKSNNNWQNILNEHKNSNIELTVDTETDDFREVEIWDEIKVYVNMGNDLLYTNTTMKVESKTWDGEIDMKIWLANKSIKTMDVIEKINNLQERVSLIEL